MTRRAVSFIIYIVTRGARENLNFPLTLQLKLCLSKKENKNSILIKILMNL